MSLVRPSVKPRWRGLPALVGLLLAASACPVRTIPYEPRLAETARPSEAPATKLETLLDRYVDASGRVDFAAWAQSPADVAALTEVVRALADALIIDETDTPDASPARLASWINFYNAFALHNVLARWPNVEALEGAPFGRALLYDETVVVQKRPMSLQDVENEVLRRQFDDPRVHFALHCGARSCPILLDRPFDPTRLDQQLDDAARAFVQRDGHITVDHGARTVHLSALFGWYEADFQRFVATRSTHPAPGLLDFVLMYAHPALADDVRRARDGRYGVRWQAYDWRVGLPASAATAPELVPTPATTLDGEEPWSPLRTTGLDGVPWVVESKGNVLLVDVWATWCRPCLAAFPRYHELQLAYEKQGLRVVAIAEDDAIAPVRAFVRVQHTGITVVHDDAHLALEAPLSVRAMPTVLLVDRKGVIRHRHEGYQEPALEALRTQIETLLAESP